MRKILIVAAILLVGAGIFVKNFYNQNLRGVGSPINLPVGDIVKELSESVQPSENTTGFPLKLPAGFSISVFAKNLSNPRVLASDTTGRLLVSTPASGRIVGLTDENGDGVADGSTTVMTGLNRPHGLAFKDGKLYVAETNAVAVYDYDSEPMKATNRKKIIDLPGGGNHFSRTIAFGPDGRLYIAIGSTCNVCIEKNDQRAAVMVANGDGSNLKHFAKGLRNSVFFTWHPKTGELWGTDMGRDRIGDDLPPEEINIIKEGNNYGWPFCYGKQVHDKNFDASQKAADFCKTTTPSHIDYQAHSAPLGLAFIPDTWPKEYRDDLLVAYHGSWNRTEPTGYKIVRFKLDEKGNYLGAEDFISGWLTNDGALGRPVDLLFDESGVLYISDDKAGVVYRVSKPQ